MFCSLLDGPFSLKENDHRKNALSYVLKGMPNHALVLR